MENVKSSMFHLELIQKDVDTVGLQSIMLNGIVSSVPQICAETGVLARDACSLASVTAY